MEPFADLLDVEDLWRPLTARQQTAAVRLLTAASALIRSEVALVDERIANGSLDAAVASLVTAQMVVRVLRNPDALRSESLGGWSASYIDEFVVPFLALTAEERKMLSPRSKRRGIPRSIRLKAGLW